MDYLLERANVGARRRRPRPRCCSSPVLAVLWPRLLRPGDAVAERRADGRRAWRRADARPATLRSVGRVGRVRVRADRRGAVFFLAPLWVTLATSLKSDGRRSGVGNIVGAADRRRASSAWVGGVVVTACTGLACNGLQRRVPGTRSASWCQVRVPLDRGGRGHGLYADVVLAGARAPTVLFMAPCSRARSCPTRSSSTRWSGMFSTGRACTTRWAGSCWCLRHVRPAD